MTDLTATTLLAAGDGEWGHPWWPLWPLLWAVLIGAAVWLVLRRRRRTADPADRAREILAERYARGELSATELRERLDTLRQAERGA
jgi:putative membrane protein